MPWTLFTHHLTSYTVQVHRENLDQISICCERSLPLKQLQIFKVLGRLDVPSILETLLQFFFSFRLSVSLHVIPDWFHDVEIRALWGPDHLLHDFLFFLSLEIVLYDSVVTTSVHCTTRLGVLVGNKYVACEHFTFNFISSLSAYLCLDKYVS